MLTQVLRLWWEVPSRTGWKSLPKRGFPKAPPRYLQTRGACNNIGGILANVWGSGMKARFWPPFWQGNHEMSRLLPYFTKSGRVVCKEFDNFIVSKKFEHKPSPPPYP